MCGVYCRACTKASSLGTLIRPESTFGVLATSHAWKSQASLPRISSIKESTPPGTRKSGASLSAITPLLENIHVLLSFADGKEEKKGKKRCFRWFTPPLFLGSVRCGAVQ